MIKRMRTEEASKEDDNVEERKLSEIKMLCAWAVHYIDDKDGSGSEHDSYARQRFESSVRRSLSIVAGLDDKFYRSAGLHMVSDLLSRAGEYDRATDIIESMDDAFVRERAYETMAQIRRAKE